MAKLANISGLNKVLQNLKTAKTTIARGVGRGLKKGGLHLLRATDKYTPVDLGALKNSKFCRNVGGSGFNVDIIVGFTVEYAVYVHEDMDKAHGRAFNEKYAAEIAAGTTPNRGENQQAKFLERPVHEERRKILRIIRTEAGL